MADPLQVQLVAPPAAPAASGGGKGYGDYEVKPGETIPLPPPPEPDTPAPIARLIYQKRQLITEINTHYNKEAGRMGRANDALKAGGLEGGKSRDGLSSLGAIITEHGLYSQEANSYIQQRLQSIDNQLEYEKAGGWRRPAFRMSLTGGILGVIAAGALLATGLIIPAIGGLGIASAITGGLATAGWITGGIALAIGGGLSWLFGTLAHNRRAHCPHELGYARDEDIYRPVQPETPVIAQERMMEAIREFAGVDPGTGMVDPGRQMVNLNNPDRLEKVGNILAQAQTPTARGQQR